ncbi:hypothetical protein PoB_004500000 [Plakobranchus ocellatus]|uniref:Uncharacterized protein n=1 Tax=Plakobranchus ocellatus TaxID=259542 RepID=A0AAV4BHD4_9GAST|nr:hypothetical protein PoB_004500000 [Plakobranchus ocellatus]
MLQRHICHQGTVCMCHDFCYIHLLLDKLDSGDGHLCDLLNPILDTSMTRWTSTAFLSAIVLVIIALSSVSIASSTVTSVTAQTPLCCLGCCPHMHVYRHGRLLIAGVTVGSNPHTYDICRRKGPLCLYCLHGSPSPQVRDLSPLGLLELWWPRSPHERHLSPKGVLGLSRPEMCG